MSITHVLVYDAAGFIDAIPFALIKLCGAWLKVLKEPARFHTAAARSERVEGNTFFTTAGNVGKDSFLTADCALQSEIGLSRGLTFLVHDLPYSHSDQCLAAMARTKTKARPP